MALVRRADVAEELAQETFFRAWRARRRYREEGSVRGYLMRIADRLICDRARKLGREIQVKDELWRVMEPATPSFGPADVVVHEEAKQQLAVAISRLSPAQRRVLLLRYYGDLSFAEIAAVMQCPLGTALSHCHRALRTLREQLIGSER
jgi:RNA polymerase sigma-70 factor (ECF subfamily)